MITPSQLFFSKKSIKTNINRYVSARNKLLFAGEKWIIIRSFA